MNISLEVVLFHICFGQKNDRHRNALFHYGFFRACGVRFATARITSGFFEAETKKATATIQAMGDTGNNTIT